MVDFAELAAGVVGGAVAGWVAHYLYGRLHRAATPGWPASPPRAPPPRLPPGPPPGPIHGAPATTTVGLAPVDDGLGLARRVLAHLGSLGRLGNDEVARREFTQEGIADALGVRQGNASKVLARLVAAGALSVDRRHVSGIDRRRNVYRLTALGESVARDLRRPRRPSARPRPPTSGEREVPGRGDLEAKP